MADSQDDVFSPNNQMLDDLVCDPGDGTVNSSYEPFPNPLSPDTDTQTSSQRFPAGSLVTTEQCASPAIRDKCDRSAAQHKELYPNPSTSVSFVYGESPYVCPCSDDACMMQFDTKEAAMADCLQHDPDRRGHQVQFMEPYWTADRPQQILFRPHGPLIEIGQSLAWPKAERYGMKCVPLSTTKQMYALARTAAGAAKVEALYAEAHAWAGKQPQGIAYLFSKFDWKEYEDHDKNSDYVRQYPCPVLGCNFTAFRPNAIYKHINSKQHNTSELPQAAQHVIYQGKEIHSLRVIIRADGEPDYIPCKPRTDSVTAAHKAHDSVEEEELKQNGGGSSSKRHRKQTEPYRPAAAQLKQHKKATAAQAAKAAATAADNNIQMEFLCEAKEAYGRAMETNKKMYDMQLAHAEALNKQAAAHTEELHSMAIAAAERNTDTKVLEAKLASERRVTMLYNKTCIPLLNAANNLAAVAPVGHAANPNMDGYLET